MHHHRLLRQACVAFECVFDFFLRGGVLLPSLDLLLEHFGPRAVQLHLFARAFVNDFKTMAFQQGLAGHRGRFCWRVSQHMHHGKSFGFVEQVHAFILPQVLLQKWGFSEQLQDGVVFSQAGAEAGSGGRASWLRSTKSM